jgi:hypothetical protein
MTGWRLVYIRLTPCADVFRRFQGLMQILRWIKTKAAPTARNVGFRVVLQTGGTAGARDGCKILSFYGRFTACF